LGKDVFLPVQAVYHKRRMSVQFGVKGRKINQYRPESMHWETIVCLFSTPAIIWKNLSLFGWEWLFSSPYQQVMNVRIQQPWNSITDGNGLT
jgi:hypothetical protein